MPAGARIVLALMIGIGVLLGCRGIVGGLAELLIRVRGCEAVGVVTNRYRDVGRFGGVTYNVDYTFQTESDRSGELPRWLWWTGMPVSKEFWDAATVGTSVSVMYDPDLLSANRLVESTP